MTVGHVEKYPCDCSGSLNGICWIVHHPALNPPVSYPTERKALRALKRLQKTKP